MKPFTVPEQPFAVQPKLVTRRIGRGNQAELRTGRVLTGNLLCYHNCEEMGTPGWRIKQAVLSNRLYVGAEGVRIWVVAGSERPRRLHLVGWFTCGRPVQAHMWSDFEWLYAGTLGEMARTPKQMVDITRAKWLPKLRRAWANYASLQHVTDKTIIGHLEGAWRSRR